MFAKILIANRGEIACRVIRTARRMGIATVAVYSQADRGALHVDMADEAIAIGPARAAESYLSIPAILEAVRATGAEAVHPGYGFLSENAAFARALEAMGVAFIGPPPAAIEAMGDKIESKRTATRAGVSVVPGAPGVVADADAAAAAATAIGYPVMVKASAGGGGKGMRVARDAAELREGFALAQSEARSSFGDDRMFVEAFIEDPRHIEIQVLADAHGNVIHLGERECSIQRRNQKVLEEAPSPFLDAATRAAMGAQAVALAAAVGYRSAGTVEFIVDRARKFYFLEMNTRLQVEHPVTELVTGLDLVELMIRVAAGEALPLCQDDVRMDGWAVEARVYAEDPLRDFLPSIGRLARYAPPAEGDRDGATVRIDSGVVEGSEISLFYDPMIAKLCTHAPDRITAIDAMADALDGFVIDGIRHNIPFLSALMAHPRWREGRLTTQFIAEEFSGGFHGITPDASEEALLAAIVASCGVASEGGSIPPSERVVDLGGTFVPVMVSTGAGDGLRVLIAERDHYVVSAWRPGHRVWRGTIDGVAIVAGTTARGHRIVVSRRGAVVAARLLTPEAAALARLMPERGEADTAKVVLCPMPGLVRAVHVAEGDQVAPGQPLAVVEAMKMENVLRAERAGRVARVLAKPGDSLAVDAVILEFA